MCCLSFLLLDPLNHREVITGAEGGLPSWERPVCRPKPASHPEEPNARGQRPDRMITTNLGSITGAAIAHRRGRAAEQPVPIERVLITVFLFSPLVGSQ